MGRLKTATAYIDGSGNSARIQACAVALFLNGECHECTEILPPHTTNNVGEYRGLLLAIRLAKELGVEFLRIRSDSRLIVEQVNGSWRCKDHRLRQLRDSAWDEAQIFRGIEIRWVQREENQQADGLCRSAIKEAEAKT